MSNRETTQNQEPDDSMPTIVPEKDDLHYYHRRQQSAPNQTGTASANTSGKSSSLTQWLLLVLIIACGGACYWLFSQSQAQHTTLIEAQKRITELEQRLSTTGEEMDQSAVALQVKVSELSKKADELWVQMDKLWASAWRKNQSEIKALVEQTSQTKQALSDKTTNIEKEMVTTSINLEVLKEQLDIQQTSATQLSESLAKTEASSIESQKQITSLEKKLSSVLKENQKLAAKIKILEAQLKAQVQTKSASPNPL
ncbi:hypothetical protein [Aliikangiella coralliicola]|uniref:Uncharacterized protein n=1 Tax=Aliikangiella coralliicola TaxID=2592383 RepID=A0A545UJ21_9GAMM|nr:hypothetical protein [Aliikangiella coralliicola]TQV89460.1 hypothetical protein FLL46_00845 [Aliikangiella coralliicola]